MNERLVLSEPILPATTQAADGMPRRAWTVAEIEAMVAAGIIPEHERFELIGGEVVPMSPKGARHETVKYELNKHFQRTVPDEFAVIPETTLQLDEKSFLEPDFCVYPGELKPGEIRGYDVLLAIEVADSSLSYDRGRKIGLYAAYGIAEVWVVDVKTLTTRVHRYLGAEGYREVFEVGTAETLVSARVPSLSLNLAALGLQTSS